MSNREGMVTSVPRMRGDEPVNLLRDGFNQRCSPHGKSKGKSKESGLDIALI